MVSRLRTLFSRHGQGVLFLLPRHVVASLITLAAMPIVVSSVSLDDYGKFVTAMAVFALALQLTAPATMNAVAAAAARGKDGTLVSVVRDRLKLAVGAAAIMVGVAYHVSRSGDPLLPSLILAGAGYLLCGAPFLTFRAFLVGKRAFRELAPWDVALGTLPSIAMAVVAVVTRSIVAVAVATFVVQAVVSAAGYVWVSRRWRVGDSYRAGEVDRSVRAYGFRLMPLSMVSSFGTEGMTFVTAYVLGFEQLAVFAVAYRLYARLVRVAADIGRDALRAEFASRDENHAVAGVRRHLGSATVGLAVSWVGCLLAGSLYLAVTMPEAYQGAIWMYAILSLAVPARILQSILALIPSVNLRVAGEAIPSVVADVTMVLGTAVLGYWLGSLGVSVAVVIGGWAGVAAAFYWSGVRRREPAGVLTGQP